MRSWFRRLQVLEETHPDLSPVTWLSSQPCLKVRFASREIVLTQPTSSFFVYLLGLQTIGVGLAFLWQNEMAVSRLLWGISLVLWGAGALLAGTSYQIFGYEIKCRGRQVSTWTSWWEVIYLVLQNLSMSAMLAAVAYSSSDGWLREVLLLYALANAIVYTSLTLAGGLIPKKRWITFERMVIFSAPILLIFLILNGWRYLSFASVLDQTLLITWLFLLMVMAAYWVYEKMNVTAWLWRRKIWFSENDVLHIGLIVWMLYIGLVLNEQIRDFPV